MGLPLGGVGLIIGFLLGITVYADNANRAGVLGLSDTLLHTMQQRIALQVSSYLQPAVHAILLAHTMLGRAAVTDHAEQAYAFAASVLAETPQIANVLFADAAGNFMLVTRAANDTSGATETKRILQSPAGHSVEWISRDAAGHVTASRQDPSDTYDARTRSWFIGARAAAEVFWSGVYIFFSERAPGVTAAVHGPDPNPDVVGVDIRLDAISRFLGGLSIGRTGRAYLVAKDGEMIAGPDPTRILQTRDATLAPARIDGIGDPDLVAAWDHFRAEGVGDRIIEASGRRLISIVTPLAYNNQSWLLFITVPEVEFSGFVATNSRRAGLLSLVVVALAAGLGVLLVRQGLRADRAARIVAERSAAVRQQSTAFVRLATEAGMFAADGTPPDTLAETLAAATSAKRAGIWRLPPGAQVLRCDDSFEPATGGHVGGLELSCQEVPALIEALMNNATIDAPDARRDRRTTALHRSLMTSSGTTAVLAVPITQADRAVGMVLLEDARRDPAVLDFARACATLVALAQPTRSSESAAFAPRPARVPTEGGEPAGEPAADTQGLDPALAASGPGDQVYPQAVVLVLTLPDAAEPLAHQIACAAQDIASAHDIPYIKMMGAVVVAAAGYASQARDTQARDTQARDTQARDTQARDTQAHNSQADDTHAHEIQAQDAQPHDAHANNPHAGTDPADPAPRLASAAPRLAAAAIELRDRCTALFEDTDAVFGLGLDVGSVHGSNLGVSPGVFNLWGEAVQGASALAASAPAEAIQASEQAYVLLRQTFLFRPRGLFHRPRIGETRSYVLAGHA